VQLLLVLVQLLCVVSLLRLVVQGGGGGVDVCVPLTWLLLLHLLLKHVACTVAYLPLLLLGKHLSSIGTTLLLLKELPGHVANLLLLLWRLSRWVAREVLTRHPAALVIVLQGPP
jgi:hypothetical protein